MVQYVTCVFIAYLTILTHHFHFAGVFICIYKLTVYKKTAIVFVYIWKKISFVAFICIQECNERLKCSEILIIKPNNLVD